MRPRKKDRNLPACMYLRHGSYFLVKRGKWTNLGRDYAKALQEYALLTNPKGGGMAELIDEVLRHVSPSLAENTVKQYTIAADRLKAILLEFAPEQVRPMHVAAIKTEHSKTPAMANRLLSFLRVVFQYAVEWQRVESNPCVGIKRHKEQARGRYMTDAEYLSIRSAAEHKAIPAIMDLCFLTGQRIGDILSLRNDQISKDGISFVQQKTGAKLLVQMTPDLKAAIALARASHPQKIGPAGAYLTLFYTRGGKPYSYGTIRDAFDRAKEAAGVKDVTLHDLRAKALTDANQEGHDAQKLGGHTDRRMTERYIRQRQIPVAAGPKSVRKKVD